VRCQLCVRDSEVSALVFVSMAVRCQLHVLMLVDSNILSIPSIALTLQRLFSIPATATRTCLWSAIASSSSTSESFVLELS
jgi:hypothetical protein